ncbi:MAG: hypothetical protein AB3N28_00035, partial [Kordiimonas sp.]
NGDNCQRDHPKMTSMSYVHPIIRLSYCLVLLATLTIATTVQAQDSQTNPSETEQQDDAPDFNDPNVQRSIQYMLERAQLTRTFAEEHLSFLKENRTSPEIRQMEDASQVMAFNRVCSDEKIDKKTINHIAADTSFRIAMLAGESTISERLARITASQTVNKRMELVGDIATTVLMFEVGRRQGLFEALVNDFGVKRFCTGMQDDMRTRYNDLASNLGSVE